MSTTPGGPGPDFTAMHATHSTSNDVPPREPTSPDSQSRDGEPVDAHRDEGGVPTSDAASADARTSEAFLGDAQPFDVDALEGVAYPLAPRILSLWFWQSLFGLLPIAGATLALTLVTGALWLPVVGIVVAIAWLIAARRYGRAYLARFRCVLLPDGLLIRRGVVFRSEIFVPRPRIQHTDVTEGPVARHYGIATLKVFTAGTQLAQLGVEGLPHAAAIELRDRLLGRAGPHAQ